MPLHANATTRSITVSRGSSATSRATSSSTALTNAESSCDERLAIAVCFRSVTTHAQKQATLRVGSQAAVVSTGSLTVPPGGAKSDRGLLAESDASFDDGGGDLVKC